MELRREEASAYLRASGHVPSLCHLLVWHMMPELCPALLPSPLLPCWFLSVFFHVFVLFFPPTLPPLFFALWLSKGRSASGTPKIITKAQVGFSLAVHFLSLNLDFSVSQ